MAFGYELIIILLMLVFNALFAAYEMALASISRAQLTVLVNQKRKGAEEAAFMKDRMEASLAVVQVGITLVGAVAAAFGGAGVAESFSPYLMTKLGISETASDILALMFLIIPLSAVTIIFAELVPKTYALNHKVWVCLTFSPFMKVLSQLAYPVVALLEAIVKRTTQFMHKRGGFKSRFEDQIGLHELNAAVSLARTSRLIGAREEKIVLSAAQLSVRPVREIMLPISDISMIPADSSLADALLKAHLDMHTRFPVCASEKDSQSLMGYVNFKDIMMALKLNPTEPSIKGIIRPIKTVTEDTPISQVLEQMMQEKLHIAMVSTQGQKIIGMITLEDIIEELVGEIEDEFDRLPTHIHPYGNGWIMGGGVLMNTTMQIAGLQTLSEREGSWRLADWFAKKIKEPLKGGEVVETNGLHVMVRKLRRKKVGEAIVSVAKK